MVERGEGVSSGQGFSRGVGAIFAALTSVLFGWCVMPPATAAASDSASWQAPASVEAIVEQHSVPSGDAKLATTWWLPRSVKPVSAIVVTHGASSPLRGSPLYLHLRQMLPALGIAVVVYDRRGSGESTGKEGDYAQLADDAIAVAKALRADKRIDPKRIGIWGLSQGGWIALLAASRGADIRFVISISAPLVTPDVQMMFYSTNVLRVKGYSNEDIEAMRATRQAVDDYMRGVGDQAAAQALIDKAKTRPWFKYLYLGETVRDREVSGWRKEIEHDPLQTFENVIVPTLVLYGAADPVVPVRTSVEKISRLARRPSNLQLSVIAGADHSMQLGVDPKIQLDPAHADEGRPDAPEYFAVLTRWLVTTGIGARW